MTKLSGPMVPPPSGIQPSHAVVLLHGYGSNGSDLIALAPPLQEALPHALFLAPNAPEPCQGNPFGFQWFALDYETDRVANRQQGLPLAAPVLQEFLDDLWSQTAIAPERTILAGFSQGAMTALHAGLSLPEPLLGIVAFSGAFVPPAGFGGGGLAQPPVCLVHGDHDEVVDPRFSAEAEAALRSAGVQVSLHVCRGVTHGISPDGLAFAIDFIRKEAGE